MLHLIKQTLYYMKWNWLTLLLFELIHKFFALVVIIPTFFSILTSMMQQADLTYLSPSVIYHFIFSPSTLILGFSMILCLGYYFFFEIQAIFILIQSAIYQQRPSIFRLIEQSIKQSCTILYPKNIILLFPLIFFIPVSAFVFKFVFLDGASMTEFLFDFIYQRAPLHPMYFAFIVLIELLCLRFIFTCPVFIYKKTSVLSACQESFQLTQKNVRQLIPLLISWSLLVAIAFMTLYGFFIFSCALVIKVILPSSQAMMVFFNASLMIKNMLTIIAPSLFLIGTCAFITTLYVQSPHSFIPHLFSGYASKRQHPILLVSTTLILSLLVGELISPDNLYNVNQHLSDEMQIIAHRASATHAPENTLAALDYAILSGAHMAEIDVQQTKDGEIILMHDANLKRTTGFNRKVSEATYSDIQTLEAGNWFSSEFDGEPVPTLEEVLQRSKGQITLMIEIKAKDHPVDVARKVIELIKTYNMEKECLIGAMDYRVLQAVKMINPKIQTVYITALAYGDYQDLEDVDYYSIEASFISYALIDQIHRSGKQIYAWTVNKESTMQSMISMQVDGIVTDDPVLLQNQLTHISDRFISFISDLLFGQ
ncbi:glycerophosphodiester phosphodiesterase family protein [Turicibacter bilis]|uniref:Glycerophosphodiester phosphodiesterase n=1 Tax=Turicibacter bilis TaxID=2735723 RepID=A0ABY5JJ39_9FIRM|nr:glycerophosphodiester phosphodiesterase [Turicibacter bilis]MBS3199774.1 glycerophosphodiester phosphodiesterase [Turicibacter bilis]UUF06249.1 glycerophosphodiester phosphodiesterase [Turicibacter bilis]